jgi:hypothetical protein
MIAQRWIVLLRGMWTALPAIGFVASLCACAPSSPPVAASKPAPREVPVIASPLETPHYYGSSTEPRFRHRATAKRIRHRYERQQAQAEWVNPPFGAGE